MDRSPVVIVLVAVVIWLFVTLPVSAWIGRDALKRDWSRSSLDYNGWRWAAWIGGLLTLPWYLVARADADQVAEDEWATRRLATREDAVGFSRTGYLLARLRRR